MPRVPGFPLEKVEMKAESARSMTLLACQKLKPCMPLLMMESMTTKIEIVIWNQTERLLINYRLT